MSIFVHPSYRPQQKVLKALLDLNLEKAELVFMDCPDAKEKYPTLNVVGDISLATLEKANWLEGVKAALSQADALVFFLSANRSNLRTCEIYRGILGKKKLMWIYDVKEEALVNDILNAEKAEQYVRKCSYQMDVLVKKVLSTTNSTPRGRVDVDQRPQSVRDADMIRVASILEMLETTVKDIQNAKLGIKELVGD